MKPSIPPQLQPPSVVINSPSTLIACLPPMLGYRPREAVVIILAGVPGRDGPVVLRADLPSSFDQVQLVRKLAEAVNEAGGLTVQAVAWVETPPAVPGTSITCWAWFTDLLEALNLHGVEVAQAVVTNGTWWWNAGCALPCCPTTGAPVDQGEAMAVRAEFVGHGLGVLPAQEELEEGICADPARQADVWPRLLGWRPAGDIESWRDEQVEWLTRRWVPVLGSHGPQPQDGSRPDDPTHGPQAPPSASTSSAVRPSVGLPPAGSSSALPGAAQQPEVSGPGAVPAADQVPGAQVTDAWAADAGAADPWGADVQVTRGRVPDDHVTGARVAGRSELPAPGDAGDARDIGDPSDAAGAADDLARIIAALDDVRVRDTLMFRLGIWSARGVVRPSPVHDELRRVLQGAPEGTAAPAATVLCILYWLDGQAARSSICLERAMREDPEYNLAKLMQAVHFGRVTPKDWRRGMRGLTERECRSGVPRGRRAA